jgi:hypothetical protein
VPLASAKVRLFPHRQDPFGLTGILTLKDPVYSEVNAKVRSIAMPLLAPPYLRAAALAWGDGWAPKELI